MSALPPLSVEERYVRALAYQILGQVLNSNAGTGEYFATATDTEAGVRITLSIEQIEGAVVARWEPVEGLREIELVILEAAPGPTETPIPIKNLATKAGYSYSQHFRDAVSDLVRERKLVRFREGVRRA